MLATRIDVMTTLCSAFGVFSAFGVAILAFFTGGGGLQRISSWLVRRAEAKASPGSAEADGKAMLRGDVIVWVIAGVVALTVIVSGVGLFTSFYWLVAVAHGEVYTPSWSYECAQDMFYSEAVIITVVTVVAIIGTALAALPNSKTTRPPISASLPRPGQAVAADGESNHADVGR
jgi:uncharacterized membrane protein YedE/YeeE